MGSLLGGLLNRLAERKHFIPPPAGQSRLSIYELAYVIGLAQCLELPYNRFERGLDQGQVLLNQPALSRVGELLETIGRLNDVFV